MLTLNIYGPIDQVIENVTREEIDALLSEPQPDVKMFCLDYPNGSVQLVIGSPKRGVAVVKIITAMGVEKTEFDNIPDAISAYRELTAHLFN